MKGFIHLIEVAIAGMIIILVIPTFFTAQIIKHSWERADLIATANDIIDSLKASGDLEKILNESEIINKINALKPPNIKYSLKITEAPKQNILVGCCECTDTQLARAKEFLTPVYVNNRWINFTVEKIKIDDIKILAEFNDSTITKDVVFETADNIVDAWINVSKSTNVIEAKMDVSGDLNVDSYPSDIAIDIGNSGVNDFSFTSELNLGNSPKQTSDFSSKLNSILQTCSCSGCSLFDNYCTIPINVTSQTKGIVRLSNLFIKPKGYDNILFIDYTNFDENQIIQNYIKTGKPVVAVTDITDETTFNKMNYTFNLSAGSPGSTTLNFTKFAPEENKIAKYFLGFGFGISTPTIVGTKKQGDWYIWEGPRQVNITADRHVEVENKTTEEGIINVIEGGSFNLKGPDLNFYTFKVKKIFDMSNVTFQALNTSFVFKDFSDSFKVSGNNVISNPDNTFAAMTTNGTSIWISNFPQSDEYKTLVKTAIAQPEEWYLVENVPERKFIDASTFVNLCCDMPETIGLEFMLWYMY